ncbi:hypothetical protein R1sor_025164 [Riccia sorocarpa]|uniref:Transposase n=1 Tax=Riccia sorocarpa TaxID=122646 RepID=A0ABD3G971_9MARC
MEKFFLPVSSDEHFREIDRDVREQLRLQSELELEVLSLNRECGSDVESADNRRKKKVRGRPSSSFTIDELLGFSPRRAVELLKKRFKGPVGEKSKFGGLNESTLRHWIDKDRQHLTPRINKLIKNPLFAGYVDRGLVLRKGLVGPQPPEIPVKFRRGAGRLGQFGPSVWSGKPELESEFVELLEAQRNVGCTLNSVVIQCLLRGFLLSKYPEILTCGGGPFQCSRTWVKRWVREKLGWSFRQSTTAAWKLPEDWELQGKLMASRLAYLVLSHKIPRSLVVIYSRTWILVTCVRVIFRY